MQQLRPWRLADAADLVRCRASHDDLDRQLPPIPDQVVARSWIRDRERDEHGLFLALLVDGRAVGQVAVSHQDRRHGTGWFSYWIEAEQRGRGLMRRAAATVADWALAGPGSGGLGLYRLELGHRVDNPASARVAESAGFVVEGLERERFCYDGRRHDVRTMARLVTDPAPPRYEPIALQSR